MRRWTLGLVAFVSCVGVVRPASARAYSDYTLFAEPALEGGGDGRWFTGSKADGFGCSVCHTGGRQPVGLVLEGWPSDLVPGERYDVVLRWPAGDPVALQLEIARDDGVAPDVALGSNPASDCEGVAGDAATYQVDVGSRRILGVSGCGATEIDFSFVAPVDGSPVTLSASAVRSDRSEGPDGDSVRTILRTSPGVIEGDGCDAAGTGGGCLWLYVAFFGLVRQGRRRLTVAVRSRAQTDSRPTKAR